MFDQFNGKNRKRFGMAMAISTAVEVLLVAMLIIVPFFMTNTLSVAALADKLLIPLPPPPPSPPPVPPARIRVGGNVQAANLLFQAKPVYPALAKNARIHGM